MMHANLLVWLPMRLPKQLRDQLPSPEDIVRLLEGL